jgi:arylsulfatase A-like enzyme
LSSFTVASALLATTVFALIFVYLLLWLLVGLPLQRFLPLKSVPLSASIASFLATLSLLAWLTDISLAPWSAVEPSRLFVLLLLSLSVATGTYFAGMALGRYPNYRRMANASAVATPSVLGWVCASVWLYTYKIEGTGSRVYLVLFLIFAVTLTIILSNRISTRIRSDRVLALFLLVVTLLPGSIWAVGRTPQASTGSLPASKHRIQRVILITIDTLRSDVPSCYNPNCVPTPHIDQLAKDGIIFRNAVSAASWTLPAVASIMTGRSPWVHQAVKMDSELPESLPTLAELLRKKGFYTAAIVSNPFLAPQFNLSQGFLEYVYFPRPIGNSTGARLLSWGAPDLFDPSTDALTRSAADWLESNADKSFFLWLHYLDPHVPYAPPEDFYPQGEPPLALGYVFSVQANQDVRYGKFVPSLPERAWMKKLYDAETRYVDESLGKLLDGLKQLDVYDDSLIILTSDHGEEFWEHDGYEHGHTLYGELLRVPLIVKLPASAAKKEIVTPVATQALMPTIMELCCGSDLRDRLGMSSLVPLWQPAAGSFHEQPIVSMGSLWYENRESVIFDSMKYVRTLLTNREELYDLARDPEEKTSLATEHREQVEMAKEILQEHRREAAEVRKQYGLVQETEIQLDEQTRELLKTLGYVQ